MLKLVHGRFIGLSSALQVRPMSIAVFRIRIAGFGAAGRVHTSHVRVLIWDMLC